MMATAQHAYWQDRLGIPAYRVGEAARYARTSAQTVSNWQKVRGDQAAVIAARERRAALSYLQLIEIGVVAAMRRAGVKLNTIRDARAYLVSEIKSEFPFAQYRFKTDGTSLFMGYEQIVGKSGIGKLIVPNKHGQLAWNHILRKRLREFEYDKKRGTVSRWKVGGATSPVEIDPRIAFGAPHVGGIATWVLRERWNSGESLEDIAEDFDLSVSLVEAALHFEGVEVDSMRPKLWSH